MNKLEIPRFNSEKEEADWWFANREATSAALVKASQEGRAGEGSAARQARRIKEANERSSAA